MGPSLGPKEADSNPRNFDEDVLKAGQTVIGLQAGSNRGASQSGMNFGKTRSILDWLLHLCIVWIVRSTSAFYQPLLVPSEVNQTTISSVLAKPSPLSSWLDINWRGSKEQWFTNEHSAKTDFLFQVVYSLGSSDKVYCYTLHVSSLCWTFTFQNKSLSLKDLF